jgi:hypothetical protein
MSTKARRLAALGQLSTCIARFSTVSYTESEVECMLFLSSYIGRECFQYWHLIFGLDED